MNDEDKLWSVALILYHENGTHTLVCGWKRAATKDDAISLSVKEASRDFFMPWIAVTAKALQIPLEAMPHEE